MSTKQSLQISDLKLDLVNFRTVPQTDEEDAVHAMVSIRPEWFWSLTESLLSDGYLPTENIIVLKSGINSHEHIVKEGNRRIGALKLISGHFPRNKFAVPSHIEKLIKELTDDWKKANETVPCAVYEPSEAEIVDKIVTLTHGKGEKAGRDEWNAVARARHNRDKNKANEPALELLEKYLKSGKNRTPAQAERWSGDYPLTILDDAIKRFSL